MRITDGNFIYYVTFVERPYNSKMKMRGVLVLIKKMMNGFEEWRTRSRWEVHELEDNEVDVEFEKRMEGVQPESERAW